VSAAAVGSQKRFFIFRSCQNGDSVAKKPHGLQQRFKFRKGTMPISKKLVFISLDFVFRLIIVTVIKPMQLSGNFTTEGLNKLLGENISVCTFSGKVVELVEQATNKRSLSAWQATT
jgi:hypothetical protein